MGKQTSITHGESFEIPITLDGLANNQSRQGDMQVNYNDMPAAKIAVEIKSGTAPTLYNAYRVHLIGKVDGTADDGAGDNDAAITIENAPYLGSIIVTATANKTFKRIFKTERLGALDPEWTVAITNYSGQALADESPTPHKVSATYYIPEQES